MCGRAYATYTDEELAVKYLDKKQLDLPDFEPNYNLSPTQLSPVVIAHEGTRTIKLMRWGLVPAWAKSIQDASKYSLINAKGEEILEKRSYSVPFQKRRCIVPLSGFYEWKREDAKNKRPFAIHFKSAPIMSLAGVWEHWVSATSGEIVDSFSVITVASNAFMEKIHHRMPVFLKDQDFDLWLNPNSDLKSVQKLLQPYDPEAMQAYEVSKLVNSPKNNRKELLAPVCAVDDGPEQLVFE